MPEDDAQVQPQPFDPGLEPDTSTELVDPLEEYTQTGVGFRASDPIFGLLIALAVSFGLLPLIGENAADMRYTLSWGVLAVFGVLGWLFGGMTRIEREKIENIAWGVVFGLLLAVPLLGFGGQTLTDGLRFLFPQMSDGTLLAYLVFVMPLAETLFFRGLLQEGRSFWTSGLLATVWNVFLFFSLMNRGPLPLILGTVLLMMNLIYSYVRQRNGLAAAWVCQITINLVLIFFPLATG
ncbi:MAG: hypothetical protein SF029_12070 [bacterium]|nr:hypothetical protein [bacterium]